MKKTTIRIMLAAAILTPAVVLAKVAPDLSTPETCAKTYATHAIESKMAGSDDQIAYMEWDIKQDEAEMGWYKDKSEREKNLKKEKAMLEFVKANMAELKKYEVEIVGKKDIDKSNVSVEVRTKEKGIDEKKGEENKFELKDKDRKREYTTTQLDGKWKIKQ